MVTAKKNWEEATLSGYLEGYPPSIRDIGKEVGLKSSSTVSGHLVKLRDKGLIGWEDGKPRTLHIINKEISFK
ncbi:transcriptional regulator [Peribacillus loiseleuriae]|uniref:Transcriptional regulator n=1 Tax=Peribacillus loiseleuriae TaxID=1679170 RepID=A0A0K9H094_9BACI|nr:transcriptional regulator [Peribacillus loiseleuriae]